MIRDPKIIQKLYDQFTEIDRECAGNVDKAFCELRENAGAAWIPNDPYNRIPDRDGKDGLWRVIDWEVFTIWKLTYR